MQTWFGVCVYDGGVFKSFSSRLCKVGGVLLYGISFSLGEGIAFALSKEHVYLSHF